MKEAQTIEWKLSWQDAYLRWIYGFANAQGGTLAIGKDDSAEVVGVPNKLQFVGPQKDGHWEALEKAL